MTVEPFRGLQSIRVRIGRRATAPRLPEWALRILREPLVHFFAAGLVLFMIHRMIGAMKRVFDSVAVTPPSLSTVTQKLTE